MIPERGRFWKLARPLRELLTCFDTYQSIRCFHSDIDLLRYQIEATFPGGEFEVPLPVDWGNSGLPEETQAFLESEFSFQPEEISLSIRGSRDASTTSRGLIIALKRNGLWWSEVLINVWTHNGGGVMISHICKSEEGQVKAAREAAKAANQKLYIGDELTDNLAALEMAKPIFTFAQKQFQIASTLSAQA